MKSISLITFAIVASSVAANESHDSEFLGKKKCRRGDSSCNHKEIIVPVEHTGKPHVEETCVEDVYSQPAPGTVKPPRRTSSKGNRYPSEYIDVDMSSAVAVKASEPVYTCLREGYQLEGEECVLTKNAQFRIGCAEGYTSSGERPIKRCNRASRPQKVCFDQSSSYNGTATPDVISTTAKLQGGRCRDVVTMDPSFPCPPNATETSDGKCLSYTPVDEVPVCADGSAPDNLQRCPTTRTEHPEYVCPPDWELDLLNGKCIHEETIYKKKGMTDEEKEEKLTRKMRDRKSINDYKKEYVTVDPSTYSSAFTDKSVPVTSISVGGKPANELVDEDCPVRRVLAVSEDDPSETVYMDLDAEEVESIMRDLEWYELDSVYLDGQSMNWGKNTISINKNTEAEDWDLDNEVERTDGYLGTDKKGKVSYYAANTERPVPDGDYAMVPDFEFDEDSSTRRRVKKGVEFQKGYKWKSVKVPVTEYKAETRKARRDKEGSDMMDMTKKSIDVMNSWMGITPSDQVKVVAGKSQRPVLRITTQPAELYCANGVLDSHLKMCMVTEYSAPHLECPNDLVNGECVKTEMWKPTAHCSSGHLVCAANTLGQTADCQCEKEINYAFSYSCEDPTAILEEVRPGSSSYVCLSSTEPMRLCPEGYEYNSATELCAKTDREPAFCTFDVHYQCVDC